MFNFLGLEEIALVAVAAVLLFNSRDLLNTYKFVNRQYLRARRYFYRIKAELLYEPPTAEELKKARDAGELYRKYGEDAPEDAPVNGKTDTPEHSGPPPTAKATAVNAEGAEGAAPSALKKEPVQDT